MQKNTHKNDVPLDSRAVAAQEEKRGGGVQGISQRITFFGSTKTPYDQFLAIS